MLWQLFVKYSLTVRGFKPHQPLWKYWCSPKSLVFLIIVLTQLSGPDPVNKISVLIHVQMGIVNRIRLGWFLCTCKMQPVRELSILLHFTQLITQAWKSLLFTQTVILKVDTWLTKFRIDRIHVVSQKGYVLYA